MKKIILALLFVTGLNAQTTEIEYNYLTKGYQETVTKGLDLKQGYELKDMFVHNETNYQFDFKLFNEQSTKKTKAILVIATSKTWGNVYYLCLPISNLDLQLKYNDYLQTWDKDILRAYSFALSRITSLSLESAD
ncbi:hypothetical protein [Flavobacterium franklandianum]|uniref:Uncharacterized protein n=1 Tax=Flavobacterium franklandianum TaxID=2594430 RepID=A0A553C8A8_9FLAO|nr:hypothetical protein [Flavobacterium franklandianum]TRX16739.1 hypothetical protein FNW17_12315 [Flavobacterium franklandianum]